MRKGKVRKSRFQEKYDPRKLADRFSWSWRKNRAGGERLLLGGETEGAWLD